MASHRRWLGIAALTLIQGCMNAEGDLPQNPLFLLRSTPSAGEQGVRRDTPITLDFSQRMQPFSGQLMVEPGALQLPSMEGSWNSSFHRFTVQIPGGLPGRTRVTVTGQGFLSEIGEPLDTFSWTFTTEIDGDGVGPQIVQSSPQEGDQQVAVNVSSLLVIFDETMSTQLGTVRLEGGPGALGTPKMRGKQLEIPIAGLAPNRQYRVFFDGFEDLAGNQLIASNYLVDSSLDFSTVSADFEPPKIRFTEPADQSSAVPASLQTIEVEFSEGMDISHGQISLHFQDQMKPLAQTWSRGGKKLSLDVQGMLKADTSYQVHFEEIQDLAGNPLKVSSTLVLGYLSFSTAPAPDRVPPYVLTSSPAEGGSVPADWPSLIVEFSEPMDNTSSTAPLLDDLGGRRLLSGRWWTGDRAIHFNLTDKLVPGTTHRIDLSGFKDRSGNAVVPGPGSPNGWISFRVAEEADGQRPFVVYSLPAQDEMAVNPYLQGITIRFSEAMDRRHGQVFLLGRRQPTPLIGQWSSSQDLSLPLVGSLMPDSAYELQLTGFRDEGGEPLRLNTYLRRGKLHFNTASR